MQKDVSLMIHMCTQLKSKRGNPTFLGKVDIENIVENGGLLVMLVVGLFRSSSRIFRIRSHLRTNFTSLCVILDFKSITTYLKLCYIQM